MVVVYNANHVTVFSVMEISFEGSSRAICKVIFFVKRILLSLPVLRLALIFLIFLVFWVYFFSTLVCDNVVGKSFGRFVCFDLVLTFSDAAPWSVHLFLTILLLTGKTRIFKDAG